MNEPDDETLSNDEFNFIEPEALSDKRDIAYVPLKIQTTINNVKYSLIWRYEDELIAEFRATCSSMLSDLEGCFDTWILVPARDDKYAFFTVDGYKLFVERERAFLQIDDECLSPCAFEILFNGKISIPNWGVVSGETVLEQRLLFRENSLYIEFYPHLDLAPESSPYRFVAPSSFCTVMQLNLVSSYVEPLQEDRADCKIYTFKRSVIRSKMQISTRYLTALNINVDFTRAFVGENKAVRIHFLSKKGSDYHSPWFKFEGKS